MTAALPSHLPLLAALVDELARSGVQHAVLSPGSRNAPILLALSNDPRIRCWSAVDERSAGFIALGLAKATGVPAAVCVTSGTAVSNLLPAATEAHEAGVPLLLLTADRPAELRDVGAGQTIDQLRIFDHLARWVAEPDFGAASPERERALRATTCRAVAATTGPGRPGPVQLNLPLREPLTAAGTHAPLLDGRPGGAPWLRVHRPRSVDAHEIADLAAQCMRADRGVIVAGRCERTPELGALLPRLAATLGWPLVADPMSGARRGPHAVAAYDLFLGALDGDVLTPDLVLRVGDLPVSKPLRAWLAGTATAAEQVMFTPEAVWADPDAAATVWLDADPARTIRALNTAVSAAREGVSDARESLAEDGWLDRWRAAESDALAAPGAQAVRSADDDTLLTEPLVAHTLGTQLGPQDTLIVGASLAIRLLERWAPAIQSPPRVLSNRGANGIDGVVSTAFGVAAAGAESGSSGRVLAYLGDLTLLYDQGGLAGASRLGLPVQFVVVNNDGGRIFERLAVAKNAGDAFEPLIATPHGLDFAHLAAFHRLEHITPATRGELAAALALPADRPRLIEVRTPHGTS
ncbi:MAG: 2-succinyl-5-enolpyruvyl-6-hydroxy-3-cyclohexene-1-carboxylic-acid synthase [Solirubrobacteraceae bacterium]|nr:2-succinyl-5-enolpyruvyl-6-hydroxy-3-cyclohexene-1-carboxylic-acid synthase [Solirubrobacteraceae bacterium]